MSIFAGQHGTWTAIGTYPRTAVTRALGDFEQSLPTGVLCTLGVATLWDAGIQVLLFDTRIEARDDVDRRRVGVALCTFIVYGTCGVELVEPGRHSGVVGAIAALVA